MEEKGNEAELRIEVIKQRSARYYNEKVQTRKLEVSDLVLRKIFLATRERNAG